MAPSCLSTLGSLRGYSGLSHVSLQNWPLLSVELSSSAADVWQEMTYLDRLAWPNFCDLGRSPSRECSHQPWHFCAI
jgi:hypothetical protein